MRMPFRSISSSHCQTRMTIVVFCPLFVCTNARCFRIQTVVVLDSPLASLPSKTLSCWTGRVVCDAFHGNGVSSSCCPFPNLLTHRCCILILSISFVVCSVFYLASSISHAQSNSLHRYCDREYRDNIGFSSYSSVLCYPQIDAVYTWVNGSDPVWFAEMEYYKSRFQKEHGISENTTDTSSSRNRFRDNDELRYSLRSLDQNAPWIHHIYIVTNGQVPSWLDTSNPRISVVTHEEIFANKEALPTFSSPAIELNLHHIEGLGEYFLYFNDDVFLGDAIYPSDLLSLENGQLVFESWEAPKCNEKCSYSQLGNGECNPACNTERCGYDFGDCNKESATRGEDVGDVIKEMVENDDASASLSSQP